MKKLFYLGLLLLLVGCNTPNPKAKNYKTAMLNTAGTVEVIPNMATFSINLSCIKPHVKEAKNCLVDKSNELTDKLLQMGIAQEDLLTTSVNLSKSYQWVKNTRVFQGYRSSTSLYVTVKDMDLLEGIYTELLENRNLNLGGLQYSHSQMDSLQNEAYALALRNSNKRMERLMSQLPESNFEIIKLGNVSLSSTNPEIFEDTYNLNAYALEEVELKKNMTINTGTVTITANINVEYLLLNE